MRKSTVFYQKRAESTPRLHIALLFPTLVIHAQFSLPKQLIRLRFQFRHLNTYTIVFTHRIATKSFCSSVTSYGNFRTHPANIFKSSSNLTSSKLELRSDLLPLFSYRIAEVLRHHLSSASSKSNVGSYSLIQLCKSIQAATITYAHDKGSYSGFHGIPKHAKGLLNMNSMTALKELKASRCISYLATSNVHFENGARRYSQQMYAASTAIQYPGAMPRSSSSVYIRDMLEARLP